MRKGTDVGRGKNQELGFKLAKFKILPLRHGNGDIKKAIRYNSHQSKLSGGQLCGNYQPADGILATGIVCDQLGDSEVRRWRKRQK